MSELSPPPDVDPLKCVEPEPTDPRPGRAPVVVSIVLLVATTGAAWWVWRQLPADARVPMHWNAAGEIDGYGSRASLFLLPGTILLLTLLFAGLPYIEPRRGNLLRSSRAYGALWIAVVAFLALIHGASLAAALGRPAPMDKLATGGVGAVFLILGNYLGKVRSNYFFGVRTPWTLSSELSWNKTHRLAGRLFVVLGMATMIAALAGPSGLPLTIGWLISLGAATLIPVVYSYFVWRSDPHKAGAG